ncbi:hypothetical protein K402DRAFT_321427 [Aulographum hederae CBS 113979]|uniref:rRNA-processing protein FYV7 n=1 Tax=Aulographum hederae CBS 113979 TaxID=1176131 RepID=A0A6G1HGY6_9PEZI|nr:hypothetical protein K402DRAFT_321427 [Aulographum hederae CBS 113979]
MAKAHRKDRKGKPDGEADGQSATRKCKGLKFPTIPQNMPDGVHKQKLLKKKADLLERAQIQREYAKVKQKFLTDKSKMEADQGDAEPASTELHPDRQQRLDRSPSPDNRKRPWRAQKPAPFKKQEAQANRTREAALDRQAQHEQREVQRAKKTAERERMRKAMRKARTGGKNGQMKLGKESKFLLEKVKKMVANG